MTDPNVTITLTTRRNGAKTVVAISGELDMHSCEHLSAELESTLAAALAESTTEIGVDARALTFTDSAGLRALLVARESAEAKGVVLRLTHVSDHLDRLLEMTGLREVLAGPVT